MSEDTINNIKELEIIKNDLEDKIKRLQIQENQVNNQVRDQQILLEQMQRGQKTKEVAALDMYGEKITNREDAVKKQESSISILSEEVKRREIEVDKREQKFLDLEKKEKELIAKRFNFDKYRNDILEELRIAENKITEYAQYENTLKVRESDIEARVRELNRKEKSIMDRMGEVNALELKVKIEKEHLDDLRKEKKDAAV